MLRQVLDLVSIRKPISSCMSMPSFPARVSINGQSKKSPLYVTYTAGFTFDATDWIQAVQSAVMVNCRDLHHMRRQSPGPIMS